MEVIVVEATQEADEALLDVRAIEEGSNLQALKPGTEALFWPWFDVFSKLFSDHLNIVKDMWISYLQLPQQLPQYVRRIVPLEGEFSSQRIVSSLRIHLDQLE